jgi:DNA-binding NarL/FixJ family response regulator
VNLPIIVICDDGAGKREQIDVLIDGQPELIKLGAIDRQAAREDLQPGIKVMWLELAPDPQKGLQLLGELKQKYPATSFLVSYDTLQSDLVKTAMRLGAIEFLDAEGAAKLLPDAIKSILRKETTTQAAAAAALGSQPPVVAAPEKTAQHMRESKMRTKVSEMQGGLMMPIWLLPTVFIVLIVMLAAIYFTLK